MQRGHPPPPPTLTSPCHPLHLPPSPLLIPSPSPSPSPCVGTSGVRSRKSATSTPTPTTTLTLDAHITRPSLQRLTCSAHTITPPHAHDPQPSSNRPSLDELTRATAVGAAAAVGAAQPEREIILHQLAKTDTIASISLQYGITPQALRSSNRLWPSDSIHLRTTLNIPLDQCHLPSASAGFERIVREDDGNLVLWQRGGSTSAEKQEEASILSPKARRLASASAGALELGVDTSTADLLGIWGGGSGSGSASGSGSNSFDLPDEPSRSSSGIGHGRFATTNGGGYHDLKGKARFVDSPILAPTPPAPAPADDLAASYLSSTHNPYASSSSPSSPAPLLSLSPALPIPPPPPPSTSTSTSTDPPPPPPGLGLGADLLQKRTLTISRVPSSSLSFFPPSASASTGSNPSSARSSLSIEDDYSERERERGLGQRKGSFFGPLANSLARLNLPLGPGAGAEGRQKGGLGSWSTTTTTRNSSSSSLEGVAAGGGGGKVPWTKRWEWSYFGGEEDEAWNSSAAGLGGGMGMQGTEGWKIPSMGRRSSGGGRRTPNGNGIGGASSALGREGGKEA